MAFIQEGSCECTKSELDLFSIPPTQTSVESGNWVEYHPISSISDGAPIEFDIVASGEEYLDLANSQLYVRAKICRGDGSDMEDDDLVGPINNFLHSLFSQVDVSLNGVLVSSSTNTYPYRSYIESLLSYGPAAKQSQLTSALFYKDTAGHMDETSTANAGTNNGLKKRARFTNENRVVDMIGRLHSDLFFQPKYLLNEVNVKIRLTRSRDAFALMWEGTRDFKTKILNASMFVRKVKISPSVYLAHANSLESGTAKYPIRRVICKTFTVAAGARDASNEKLFSGQLPARIIVGCIENDAANGRRDRNPYNFKHFGLREIGVYLDGQQQTIKPLECDFEGNSFVRAFASLFTGTGKDNLDEGNDIDRQEYPQGYALYAFDLSPDLAEDDHFNLVKQGTVRLDVKFAAALERTITVVVYGEFENVIEIDRNRNIVFDFNN